MLEDVKTALRITTDAYDFEVAGLIEAARAQLRLAGVSATEADKDTPAPLVGLAITVYAKAHFGYDNPESERFAASFESLTTALALSEEYKARPDDEEPSA